VDFELLTEIDDIESIAVGNAIHEISRLRRTYGAGRWRKLKGIATVQLSNGKVLDAEVHWYEAHGIGRKEIKLKRIFWE
jgi:hypothetical protein